MGWNPVGGTNTDAGNLTSGTLASARQSLAVRNNLQFPARLVLSGGNLTLQRTGEGFYVYNPLTDEQCSIATPPTLAATGASVGILYNILHDTGANTLSFSNAGTTVTNGVEHLGGGTPDQGQIVVGWAVAVTGPAWADSGANRLVCSKFNVRRKTAKAAGADQAGIVTDNTWKTPSTDMLISLIKHPDHDVEYGGACVLSHDTAITETRAGVDVAVAGTPVEYEPFWRSSGSTSYVAIHPLEAVGQSTGAAVYEQARVRVWGSNLGGTDTMSITGGSAANYLRAKLMG